MTHRTTSSPTSRATSRTSQTDVLRRELVAGQHHRLARVTLEQLGWTWLAHGDGSQVYRSPDGTQVARLVPFDSAYDLHVRTCLLHREVAYFQRIDWHCPLAPAGTLTVMERLVPADPNRASRLCCLLGETAHLNDKPTAEQISAWEDERHSEPALDALHALLHETAAVGRRTLGWFGGLDVRPGNILQDHDGQLKLFDPYNVAGPKLIQAILEDVEAVATHYSLPELQGFLEIAVFEDEQEVAGPVLEQLRRRVASLGPKGSVAGKA